jgi:aspartyl protease family protein
MRRLAFLWLACGAVLARAQPQPPGQVQLNGMLGTRAALLVIDGEPRTVEVGATVKGVKLVTLEDGRALVEYGGQRHALALGAVPSRVGAQDGGPSGARQIVLVAGSGGHFRTQGTINGRGTEFMVDTGATDVAISQVEADRLGLRYTSGRRLVTQTAAGLAPAYEILLTSVRIGEVEVYNVGAIVVPGRMPFVLLGNSFLSRFQMHRENDVMTLDFRY